MKTGTGFVAELMILLVLVTAISVRVYHTEGPRASRSVASWYGLNK